MKRIKEVMAITGLSRRTLQYYDDAGLLHVKRSGENYRLYGEDDLHRIWKILLYKEMGFSLREIRDLLDASDSSVRERLEAQKRRQKEKIAELARRVDFVEKVRLYGLPQPETAGGGKPGMTYAEMAKRISERI